MPTPTLFDPLGVPASNGNGNGLAVHLAASPRRNGQALSDQLLEIAVELERRAVLKRASDRRYRERRKARLRQLQEQVGCPT